MGAGEWVGGGIGQEVVEDFGEGGDGFGEGGGGECAGAHGVGAFDEVEEVCAFVACEEDGEAAGAEAQLVRIWLSMSNSVAAATSVGSPALMQGELHNKCKSGDCGVVLVSKGLTNTEWASLPVWV